MEITDLHAGTIDIQPGFDALLYFFGVGNPGFVLEYDS